ncbi:cytochrome C [Massilia sp. KIM]|uniref:c-type cytochrome n=1 Tax=Massilia sp. KIM TaxID=1955422 RepID=UPI00098F4E02|nr:cytochrome c [Massilia sp. KIM]OON62154.1 cytochrome C [Massilia sp. KIM]
MTPRILISLLLLAAPLTLPAMAQDGPARPDGKTLYAKNCAACHQANGRGIPGAFPALAGNDFLAGAPVEVATVLLKGRGGMPDFSASLDDAEMAEVLSYARSSWGNRSGAVSTQEVLAQRNALQLPPASRSRFGNQH